MELRAIREVVRGAEGAQLRIVGDGSLRGVPRWDRVDLFDKKDYGLVPVRVETWQGQVFVNLDADAAPLSTTMAGIAELREELRRLRERLFTPLCVLFSGRS